jgi:hypothetical protein
MYYLPLSQLVVHQEVLLFIPVSVALTSPPGVANVIVISCPQKKTRAIGIDCL